jgi:7-keto-8-aminopelargonate synthetase-like enzyme
MEFCNAVVTLPSITLIELNYRTLSSLLTVHVTRNRVLISDTLDMLHPLQITSYIHCQKHNFNHTNVTFVTELIKMENGLTETNLQKLLIQMFNNIYY